MSAHGISDAFRDAELLAGAVIEGGSHGDLDRRLAEYETTRNRLSEEVLDLTDQIAGHRWTPIEMVGLLRQLNKALDPGLDHLAALPVLPAAAGGRLSRPVGSSIVQ